MMNLIFTVHCAYTLVMMRAFSKVCELVLNKTQAITFKGSTLATMFSINTVMHAFRNKLITATVITISFQ